MDELLLHGLLLDRIFLDLLLDLLVDLLAGLLPILLAESRIEPLASKLYDKASY